MKRISVLLSLLAVIVVCFCACSGTQQTASNTSKDTAVTEKATDEATSEATTAPKATAIDVDLTKMSSTMVYSKVYDMLTNPDNYVGKTVKMKGTFAAYKGGEYRDYYFACVISDATACCQQGMEFRLKDEAAYPEDYPTDGKDITVTGTFATYMEGETQYCELENSSISF